MDRLLNVLVLDQAPGVWGAQRYLLRLAPLMVERGIRLVLGAPRKLEISQAWRDAGLDGIDLDLPIGRNMRAERGVTVSDLLREVRTGTRAAAAIAEAVRGGGYDAIWANAHWLHAEAALAGRRTRTPVVLHLHEQSVPGVGTALRAAAVLAADATVAVSAAVAGDLPAVARRKVHVIINGVDAEAISPVEQGDSEIARIRAGLGIAPDDVMVLAATRLDPSKRIEDLISAVQRSSDPRMRLVIAGSTSTFPEYEARVRALADDVDDARILFCGHREDMIGLFRACDLVLHAGTVEGMPLGLIEGQSCGKPIVAYRVAGVPEAVLEGQTGLLTEPGDVDGLSASLGALVSDSVTRRLMGSRARAHVLAQHDIHRQAARNATLLKAMCRSAESSR